MAIAAPTAREVVERGGWPATPFPAPPRPVRIAPSTVAVGAPARNPVVWAARAATAATRSLAAIAAPTAREVVERGGWPSESPAEIPELVPAPRAVVAGRATVRPVALVGAAAAIVMVAAAAFSGGGESARRAVLTAHPEIAVGPVAEPAVAPTTVPPPTVAPAPPPPPPPPPAPAPAPAPPPPVSSAGVPAPTPAPSTASLADVKGKAGKVLAGPHGTDISYPQCERDVPVDRHFAIVGVNGGRPFKPNPCLATQWQWAVAHGAASVYVNVANGAPLDETGSYVYGLQTIDYAMDYAASQGVEVPFVWLDVETLNRWNKTNKAVNAQVIRGAIDRLHQRGIRAGVYSTAHQWRVIAGDYRPGVPVWYATGANDGSRAPEKCDQRWSFTGGPVYLVQYVHGNLDRNVTCAAIVPESPRAFKMK